MKPKKHKKLRTTVICLCVSFAVILGLLIGGLGYLRYAENIQESYRNYAETLVSIIHSGIGAEELQQCIQTGTKNESFEKLQEEMNKIKENSDAQYIYMIYYPDGPQEGTIRYVMNAYTEEELRNESETISYLGDLASEEDFTQDMREEFQMIVAQNDQQVRFYDNSTQVGGEDAQATGWEYVKTAIAPIRTAQGDLVAILCLDISMTRIYTSLWSYLAVVIVGTILLMIVYLGAFITIINRRIIRPIGKIADSADDFVRQSYVVKDPSEFNFQEVEIHTRDEIELLADRLNHMVRELTRYMVDMKGMASEQERMAAELSVAKQIQLSLYPCTFPAFPERKEFDIYARLEFAQEAGGDFYNFFFTEQDRLCIMAGSVSDSGIPTTMLAVVTSTLMKNYAQLGYSPGRILAETNNEISRRNDAELDVMAFLAVVDLNTGRMDYVNAGNMIPLLKESGRQFEELPNKQSIRMGSMENVPYFQRSVNLVQGDILFLYTPGLAETMDAKGNIYSDTYVRERMDEITRREVRLDKMTAAMSEDVGRFRGEARKEKDSTMVIFRYYG